MAKSNGRALKALPNSHGKYSRSEGADSHAEEPGDSANSIQIVKPQVSVRYSLGSPGPFQIIDTECVSELDHPAEGPRRRYDCDKYETCLNLAAALNWDNFTCRGCCGEINESLLWRAQHQVRRDPMAKAICDLPDVKNRKIEG